MQYGTVLRSHVQDSKGYKIVHEGMKEEALCDYRHFEDTHQHAGVRVSSRRDRGIRHRSVRGEADQRVVACA